MSWACWEPAAHEAGLPQVRLPVHRVRINAFGDDEADKEGKGLEEAMRAGGDADRFLQDFAQRMLARTRRAAPEVASKVESQQ